MKLGHVGAKHRKFFFVRVLEQREGFRIEIAIFLLFSDGFWLCRMSVCKSEPDI